MPPSDMSNPTSCSCPLAFECEATLCSSGKERVHILKRREADTEEVEEIIDERKCNSEMLRRVMRENMTGRTVKEAKTQIMRAAEIVLGGHFNVICANGDFSYITTTRLYCLEALEDINCYAFLAEPTPPSS